MAFPEFHGCETELGPLDAKALGLCIQHADSSGEQAARVGRCEEGLTLHSGITKYRFYSDKTLPRKVQLANIGRAQCLDPLSWIYVEEAKIYL